MADMEFYYARSGNSLRAAIAVELSGLEIEKQEINLRAKENKADWFKKVNPMGTVPVLIENLGDTRFVLGQSGAIMEYLISQYRSDLWPVDPRQRAYCNAMVHSSLSDIAVQNVLARYLQSTSSDASEYIFNRMMTAIMTEFSPVMHSRYLMGNSVSIADYAHFSTVYMREKYLRSQDNLQHIVEWLQLMKQDINVANAISFAGLQIE